MSWSAKEGRIAYVAEASPADPTPEWGMGVTVTAAKKETAAAAAAAAADKNAGAAKNNNNKKGWRGQGEWREEWGEQLVGRKEPAVFILEIATGTVTRLAGLPKAGEPRNVSSLYSRRTHSFFKSLAKNSHLNVIGPIRRAYECDWTNQSCVRM